jgi:hypothetical protein
MAYFKILDVRIQYPFKPPIQVAFKRVGGQGEKVPANTSIASIAAMLDVFNSGPDCYWDDQTSTFTTDPTLAWPNAKKDTSNGVVSNWDIKIVAGGSAQIQLDLVPEEENRKTSGSAANASVVLDVPDEHLSAALAVLRSSYRHYNAGVIRNSDID